MTKPTIISRSAAFAVSAMASGVTSTLGIYDTLKGSGGGFWLAVLLGFVTFVMIFFAWDFYAAKMEETYGPRLVAGLAFLPVLLVAIFFLSSWYNAAAIVGPDALRYHIQGYALEYETAVNDAQRKALDAAQVAAAVRTETSAFRRDVDAEREEGRLTGSPGRGTVTATLEQVADRLEAMALEVESSVAGGEERLAEASVRLAELLAMLESGEYQVPAVKTMLDELRGIVIALNESGPPEVLRAVLPSLRIGLAPVDGRTSGLRERQRKALETVETRIGETVRVFEELAREKAHEATELPEYEPLSRAEAAMRYRDRYPVNWATAIAIDAFPAVILLLVLLMRPSAPPDPVEQMSVRQLRDAAIALREFSGENDERPVLHTVKRVAG